MKIRCIAVTIAVAALGAMAVVATPVRAAGSMSGMTMGDMKRSAPDAALTDAEVPRIDARTGW
jgi:hypothetical protein